MRALMVTLVVLSLSRTSSAFPGETDIAAQLPETLTALKDKPNAVPKVLVIGMDGTRADALKAATAPTIHRLASLGTISWTAHAGGAASGPTNQPTISGPGWTTILTGVWADKHGVVDNNFKIRNYDKWPHFFVRLKEVKPELRTASFVSWDPIEDLILGFPGNIKSADAHGKAKEKDGLKRDQEVVDMALKELSGNNPDVLFVYFDNIDHNGHGTGFTPLNPKYMDAIELADSMIAQVLVGIEHRPKVENENWQVIVVADHGGIGKRHGGQSPEERTISLLVAGGKMKAGVVSSDSPDQAAVPATAARHLGIQPKPEWSWDNAAFEPK